MNVYADMERVHAKIVKCAEECEATLRIAHRCEAHDDFAEAAKFKQFAKDWSNEAFRVARKAVAA